MPAPRLPPTPAASLDITGKTTAFQAPSLFLGPAAREDGSERSDTPSINGSDSSYHPASPVSPNTAKRKPSITSKAVAKTGDNFALPPPPSRSRKIIQMKPKDEQPSTITEQPEASAPIAKGGRKRGGTGGATAAGRKIARKTAHSLIERRRRSKMNEEFGILKDMIPACKGQEMHKLAILQASIDYLRYLERCIVDLKSAGQRQPSETQPDTVMAGTEPEQSANEHSLPTAATSSNSGTSQQQPSIPHYSPLQLPTLSNAHPSPSFQPLDTKPRPRQFSLTSTTASPYLPPSSAQHSAAASPIFSPQGHHPSHRTSLASIAGDAIQRFTLTSPALEPMDAAGGGKREHPPTVTGANERSDREAMAALLMLNNDRRTAERPSQTRTGSGRSGAMSVRDLLSP